jgi:type IV pilus assembly protein PilA
MHGGAIPGLARALLSLGQTRDPEGEVVKRLIKRRGGFTLIEVMIVVAIIGILAAIAITNFLKFQLKAKTSEGKTNLAAIRTAEESLFADSGNYVSANASPAAAGMNVKVAFVNVDGTDQGFDRMGWAPEGRVYFNYGVTVSGAAFTAAAGADIDADGTYQLWGYRKGSSALNSKNLGGSPAICTAAQLASAEIVMACVPANGQRIF